MGIEPTDIGEPMDDGSIDIQDIVGPEAIGHQHPGCNGPGDRNSRPGGHLSRQSRPSGQWSIWGSY